MRGLASAAQTQLNTCLKDKTYLTLTGNIGLINSGTNSFTFTGATPAELRYIRGVTSSIQTQLDSAIKKEELRC